MLFVEKYLVFCHVSLTMEAIDPETVRKLAYEDIVNSLDNMELLKLIYKPFQGIERELQITSRTRKLEKQELNTTQML